MNAYQNTIAKLSQLPEPMLQEVDHFIDSLVLHQNLRQNNNPVTDKIETLTLMKLAETGFSEWHDPEEDIYNETD
ncbi:MAG: hypothetical protein ACK58N_14535 [Synechocystis sp.]